MFLLPALEERFQLIRQPFVDSIKIDKSLLITNNTIDKKLNYFRRKKMRIDYDNHTFLMEEPSVCPHCHCSMIPDKDWEGFSLDKDFNTIYISIWTCPGPECTRRIICEHDLSYKNPLGEDLPENTDDDFPPFEGSADIIFEAKIIRFLSGTPKPIEWSSEIQNLDSGFEKGKKSKFIHIYSQAAQAEINGLDEIAGMGYRKAIEHLVKDLAVKYHPENKEEIRVKFLKEVINENFDGTLKSLLERAAWLGNDHSHYFKLFEEFDLDKLKGLIQVISTFIEQEHAMAEYLAIEGRRPKKES